MANHGESLKEHATERLQLDGGGGGILLVKPSLVKPQLERLSQSQQLQLYHYR